MVAEHIRILGLREELAPELAARGFEASHEHLLWARSIDRGLLTLVLSFSPDDAEGGWLEPFIGLIDGEVESMLSGFLNAPVTYGLRHTLIIGSTRWPEGALPRQPVHEHAEVLEAVNTALRWWDARLPHITATYGGCNERRRKALHELFNTEHVNAARVLPHELHRSMRGLAVAKLIDSEQVTATYDFHRNRLQDTGYWDIYGEQIRAFATSLLS